MVHAWVPPSGGGVRGIESAVRNLDSTLLEIAVSRVVVRCASGDEDAAAAFSGSVHASSGRLVSGLPSTSVAVTDLASEESMTGSVAAQLALWTSPGVKEPARSRVSRSFRRLLSNL
jgi:hypothetical protein